MAKHIDKTIINSFQYQIYSNADSRFLIPLESVSKVVEIENQKVVDNFEVSETVREAQLTPSLSQMNDEVKSVESTSKEVDVKSDQENHAVASFKKILNEFSSTEDENVYGQNIVSFKELEFPDHYFGIHLDHWVKIPIEANSSYPKILFLGDPGAEGLLNTEEDYDDEKFHLLIKIAKATKIPLEEFGFINCISKGQETFADSPGLAGLLKSLKSDYIVTLGAGAYQFMTGNRARLSSVHGKTEEILFLDQSSHQRRVKIIPTFHPQYILINPSIKKTVWSDFQKLIETFSA